MFDFPKWKLLLVFFCIAIGAVFVIGDLPAIMNNVPSDWNWPILAALGMFGACLIVVSIVYFAETFKEGNFTDAFKWGLIGIILGFALVIAWLWSST